MGRHSFGLHPIVALVLASAFWGVGTVISKELLFTVPPITFLIIQLVPSVLALWLIFLTTGIWPKSRRGILPILVLGLLNPGFSYTLSMIGLVQTTASVATLVWAAEPALIVVLAWLFLRETISPVLIICTVAAAAGVGLASGVIGSGTDLSGGTFGAGVILLGVFCCAIYTVFARNIVAEFDPLFVIAVQQSVALIWVLLIWPLETHGQAMQQLASLSMKEWIGGAIAGLMYYAFAYWLYLHGLRFITASRAGSFFSLIPVFGIATAFLFLGERLSPFQTFGAVIILSAVAIIQWAATRSQKAAAM